MDDVEEAKKHIQELKKARHIDSSGNGDANARTLSRALDMLSTQLYTKPTHFIMEMLQNADDNTYDPGVEPTLTLVYRDDGYLWVGCNEIGFSKSNVSAICEISDSTKKITGSQKGYIGEKGIGFKSVFKVASTVWVSSGAYTFKFNRDDLLGMIVPIWSKFKSTKLFKQQTMFCLQIPKTGDRASVRGNMLALGAEILLFLRKLKHIHVRVVSANEKKILNEYLLNREDAECGDGCTVTTLSREDSAPQPKYAQERLAVFRHTRGNMPPEDKREGVTESEIVMAFPIDTNTLTGRRTYNFLPIRDYGLPFLLQADFILTANRQDMVERNAWNEALKDHAIRLFIQSVNYFNQTDALSQFAPFKYNWPKFTISTSNASGTSMATFLSDLIKRLRDQPVLRSQGGNYRSPKELVYVPPSFCIEIGRPLFDEPENLSTYVTQQYSMDDVSKLRVTQQTSKQFCTLLRNMPTATLSSKPAPWQSKLAGALLEINNSRHLENIKIIPIRGGQWVAPSEQQIYFPDGSKIEIPDGIECLVVDDEASSDKSRRKLFEKLNVKKINNTEVCNLILERHKKISKANGSSPPNRLAAHAWYVFMTNFHGSGLDQMKLAVHGQSDTALGKDLYMDATENEFKMSRYFSPNGSLCSFIDPLYVEYGDPHYRDKWHQWLQKSFGVATLPRLGNADSQEGITDVFQSLIDNHPTAVWMSLLRDNWDYYFRSKKDPIQRVNLNRQLVSCTNGQRRQLKDVYLASSFICKDKFATKLVDLVDVPDPQNPEWLKLRVLGLNVEPDLQLCVSILRAASKDASSVPLSRGDIDRLFHVVQRYSLNDSENAWALFHDEALVPILEGKSIAWLQLRDCRWTAPACLRRYTALDWRFPSLKHFFCDTLKVPNASVNDIVEELGRESGDMNNLDNLRALLLSLSEFLETATIPARQLTNCLLKLKGAIFPVRRATGEYRLASNSSRDDWFIGDRNRLVQCFRDKVWILDFDNDDFKKLTQLFEKGGLKSRYFSNSVQEDTAYSGGAKKCKDLTAQLQSKAKYISLLANEVNQKDEYRRMKNIQVHSASDVKLRRHVTVNGREVYGQEEVGRVVVREEGTHPILFCSESSIVKNDVPWPFINASLCAMMELKAPKETTLLSILTTSDDAMIRDFLERAGLWKEDYIPEALPQRNDNDDGELPSKPKTMPDQPNIASQIKKEPSRAPSETSPSAGKKTRHSKPPNNSYKQSSKATSGSTRSSARARKAAVEEEPEEDDEEPAAEEKPKPTASQDYPGFGECPDLQETAKSQESLLIETIVSAADQYDINDAFIVGTSPTEDQSQLSGADLLQSSFAVVNSGGRIDEVSFQGELFVYSLLRDNFDAPEPSWTSHLRTRYNLEDFMSDDSATTFTLVDPQAVQRLTTWLIDHGIDKAKDWMGEDFTYHIDVQASRAGVDEPFLLSNQQLDMARRWESSESDVYIIMRVCDFTAGPKLCVYVSPLALVLSGRLQITSSGGYWVKGE